MLRIAALRKVSSTEEPDTGRELGFTALEPRSGTYYCSDGGFYEGEFFEGMMEGAGTPLCLPP